MIIQMANVRKRSSRKSTFPLMINAFRANFAAINPLKIAYDLRHMNNYFEFIPIISNEIHEFLNSVELNEKFKQSKSKSYYILFKIKTDDLDADHLIKEFSMKFDVVKINPKTDGTHDIYIKEKFSQLNLTRMTKFMMEYLKRNDPLIIAQTDVDIEKSENILQ